METNSQEWIPVWADEFDTPGPPDPGKWIRQAAEPGWTNRELQCYTDRRPENARVEDGCLVIEARRDRFGGHEYSSARLCTRGLGEWLYGRFEIMARLPAGRGTWPAIWLLAADTTYGPWPACGEIDIMEHVGYMPGTVHASVHCYAQNFLNNRQNTSPHPVPGCTEDFHLYACEWRPDRIEIYADHYKVLSYPKKGKGWQSWPFDKPFYLILNLAVGGTWGGKHGVDPDIWPKRLEVKYVRVYRHA
jgi:beta-glucanase (GH16 family)